MDIDVEKLVEKYGEPVSAMFDIDLQKGNPAYAKWLLASILYSKPMPDEVVVRAYKNMESRNLTGAASIAEAGWDQLVHILQKSGYTRYDFTTASEVLDAFKDLMDHYNGDLSLLYDASADSADLERKLRELGKGIGPAAIFIFLCGMSAVWPKASPEPTHKVKELMTTLGIDDLKEYAAGHKIDAARLKTALCRYSREKTVRHRERIDREWRERYRLAATK